MSTASLPSGRVISLQDVPPTELERGARYRHTRRQLGAAAGGKMLGCSWFEVPPGKAAWPHHFHCANEEALYILQGTPTLRLGSERFLLAPGDYVALLVGPHQPHQLINESDAPVRYLALSTMVPTDVTGYPDSDKVAFFAGSAPGGPKAERTMQGTYRAKDVVDYWDGFREEDETR